MRHLVAGRKFGKSPAHRKAMFRNMAINLFKSERIKTTDTKAKELRKFVDRIITWGKRGDLHARRLARTYIQDGKILSKVFGELGERYSTRNGGYTRIIKIGPRLGDAAPMVFIELLPDPKSKAKKDDAKPKKKKAKGKKETKEVKAEAKEDEPGKEAKAEPKKEGKKAIEKK